MLLLSGEERSFVTSLHEGSFRYTHSALAEACRLRSDGPTPGRTAPAGPA